MKALELVHLSERHDLMRPAAALMIENWPEWYGPFGPGNALADLGARSQLSGLPWGVLAVLDDTVVGTVAMAGESHGAVDGEDKWLVGLVVRKVLRKQGIGGLLVEAVEQKARTEGLGNIHATTKSASSLFVRRGWQSIRDLADGHGVFRFSPT